MLIIFFLQVHKYPSNYLTSLILKILFLSQILERLDLNHCSTYPLFVKSKLSSWTFEVQHLLESLYVPKTSSLVPFAEKSWDFPQPLTILISIKSITSPLSNVTLTLEMVKVPKQISSPGWQTLESSSDSTSWTSFVF